MSYTTEMVVLVYEHVEDLCLVVQLHRVPQIVKYMGISEYKIIVFQGQFCIISVFSIEIRKQLACIVQFKYALAKQM